MLKAPEKIQEEIRAVSEEVIDNEVARKFERVIGFYAPDAVLQAANQPQFLGRQAIWQGYQEFFSGALEMEASPTEVIAASSGDVAFEYGRNRFVLDTPDGPVELIGKYSRGWKKIGGKWQIMLQTYSPDALPPG